MEEDPNLFQDNNAKNKKIKQKQNKKQNQKIKKKKITPLKPYNVISIKTRKLLTNISFNGVTEEDFFNSFKLFFHPWRFFFDIDIQLTKNLNPFSIECKVQDKKAKEWSICYGANAVLLNSTSISAKTKILSISTRKVLSLQNIARFCRNLLRNMQRITSLC